MFRLCPLGNKVMVPLISVASTQRNIRHINPLMFDVINDKSEGFIMYKHEPVGRGFIIHYHINHGRVYVL